MEKYIDFIKKRIEPIFLTLVCIFIIIEFKKLSTEISFDKVREIIRSMSLYKSFLMVIIGFVAVLPMINYDRVFNKLVDQKLDKRYLIETSFTINSLNNLIGFGGLVNVGLRNYYYGKKDDKVELVKVILETFIYYMIGISALSLISIICIFFTKDKTGRAYILWLIGGFLYGIGVLLFSNRKKDESEKRVPRWAQRDFLLTSIYEWIGVLATFLIIGYLMGIKFDPFVVFPIIVATNIIGVVSLMPGGLGSFDVVTIIALGSIGIEKEMAFSWVLAYRLVYYIIPFFVGLIFFVKNLSINFNEKNDSIPESLAKSISQDIASFLIYVFGIFLILSSTVPDEVNNIKWLAKLNPIHANVIYQFPSILLGFIFIVLGRVNALRQKRAYRVTIIFIFISFVYANFTGFGFVTNLYLFIILLLTVFSKDELYREQFIYSWESLTMDLAISLFLIFYYLFTLRNNIKNFLILAKAKNYTIIPFQVSWLRIAIMIFATILILFALVKYMMGKNKKIGEKVDFNRLEKLLTKYGGGVDAGLGFLGDKDIYWYKNEDGEDVCALEIKNLRDRVVVMSEPIGNEDYFEKCLDEFIEHVDIMGYTVIFYEVSEELIMDLHDHGFHFMKFGEKAIVDIQNFSLEGRERKSLRNATNKVSKAGYSFEILKKPFSDEIFDKLKDISDKWLNGKKEKGFSLGFFDRDYLNREDMAVVKDSDGEIICFANLMPVYKEGWASIDLMRYDPEKFPGGAMDFLFVNLFLYLKERDIKYFDLGMAPLSNVGKKRHSFFEEKLVYLIYKFGSHLYSFEGLRAYKDKYASTWEAKYTGYSHGSSLSFTTISLIRVDRSKKVKR